MPDESPHSIILYDGVCALCNMFVRWVLAYDRKGYFHFAPQQSLTAKRLMERLSVDTSHVETIILVEESGNKFSVRSEAFFEICKSLGGAWSIMRMFSILPRVITDGIYRLIASSRYKVFGQYDSCPLPAPEYRNRFLHD